MTISYIKQTIKEKNKSRKSRQSLKVINVTATCNCDLDLGPTMQTCRRYCHNYRLCEVIGYPGP